MSELFDRFAALHVAGDPLILFNIWDAGSAKAVAEAGAKALATGSASVAGAFGYGDGEGLPMDDALDNLKRIVAATALPVTLDFEGGYAVDPRLVAENVAEVKRAGAIGINFEDRVVAGEGVHGVDKQSARIAAIRKEVGAAFFLNARTDLFLQSQPEEHAAHLDAAIARAKAYAAAGASGFFAPGLKDEARIARLCEVSPLPVNIMAFPGVPDRARLAALGVARISHGPFPWRLAMKALADAARAEFA